MLQEPEFWVAVAFIIFVAAMLYVGAHNKMVEALDRRAARIKAELDEARRLRDEAADLLKTYQKRHDDAEKEATAIIAEARAEAERVAAEAHAKTEDFIARRTKLAQTKIEQAEAQAVADVRAAAADAAVAAAETILRSTAKGKIADDLIARGIADAKAKLN
jgi:F-type H+-transporting ATPase subunit b